MTLTAASGCISKAEDLLRTMLANCTTLKTWMGAADAADALERIYLAMMPPPQIHDEEADHTFYLTELKERRPFCIVWTSDKSPFRIDMVAAPNCPSPSGTIEVLFEENVPDHLIDNYPEAYRLFFNTVGGILHSESSASPGLVELNGTAGYLYFRTLSVSSPTRSPEDVIATQGDAHQILLTVEWGATG